MGRLEFTAGYLNNGRRFLNSIETDENGELVSIGSNLNGFEQVLLNAMFSETASNFYVDAKWTTRGGQTAMPRIYEVMSVNR